MTVRTVNPASVNGPNRLALRPADRDHVPGPAIQAADKPTCEGETAAYRGEIKH